MFIMQDSWTRFISFALLGFFALNVEALPRKNQASNNGATGTTGGTKAVQAAAASPSSSVAPGGTTILDKTVQIK